jgi:hypothetical protein
MRGEWVALSGVAFSPTLPMGAQLEVQPQIKLTLTQTGLLIEDAEEVKKKVSADSEREREAVTEI